MREAIIEGLTEGYSEGRPLIEDEEFDKLVNNEDYENGLVKTKIMNGRLKIKHFRPTTSILRFSSDVEELGVLTKRTFNSNPTLISMKQSDAVLTLKINGVFISAKFNYLGELEYLITKGDKVYGMCVKDKLTWLGFPKSIDYSKVECTKFQELREKKGKDFGMLLSFEFCLLNVDHLKLSVNQLYILIGLITHKKTVEYYINSFENPKIKDYFRFICHDAHFLDAKDDNDFTFIEMMNVMSDLDISNICQLPSSFFNGGRTKEEFKKVLTSFYENHVGHSDFYTDGAILKLNTRVIDWYKKPTKQLLDITTLAFKTNSAKFIREIAKIEESLSPKGLTTYIAVLDSEIEDRFKKYSRVKIGTKLKLDELGYEVGDKVLITIVGDTSAKLCGKYINDELVTTIIPRLR